MAKLSKDWRKPLKKKTGMSPLKKFVLWTSFTAAAATGWYRFGTRRDVDVTVRGIEAPTKDRDYYRIITSEGAFKDQNSWVALKFGDASEDIRAVIKPGEKLRFSVYGEHISLPFIHNLEPNITAVTDPADLPKLVAAPAPVRKAPPVVTSLPAPKPATVATAPAPVNTAPIIDEAAVKAGQQLLSDLEQPATPATVGVANALVKSGASLNEKDAKGYTALMLAAQQPGYSDITKLLINNNAPVLETDASGKDATAIAQTVKDNDVNIKILTIAEQGAISAAAANGQKAQPKPKGMLPF